MEAPANVVLLKRRRCRSTCVVCAIRSPPVISEHANVRNASAPWLASVWNGRSFHTPRRSSHSLRYSLRRLGPVLQAASSGWHLTKMGAAVIELIVFVIDT